MAKKYVVRLSSEEREQLQELVSSGTAAAYKIKHANILLNVDAQTLNRTDEEVAKTLSCHAKTVSNLRQRFVEEGLEAALSRKKPALPPRAKKLDGDAEARLIALGCSEPPQGRSRWTLHLLAGELVSLGVVDSVSHETVRQVLKKTS